MSYTCIYVCVCAPYRYICSVYVYMPFYVCTHALYMYICPLYVYTYPI